MEEVFQHFLIFWAKFWQRILYFIGFFLSSPLSYFWQTGDLPYIYLVIIYSIVKMLCKLQSPHYFINPLVTKSTCEMLL
jgi:hypothetical protein